MAELRKALQNFSIKDSTLARDVKDNPADRISLEIGDSKQPTEFVPQAKIMRWDNEVNLSVRRVKPPTMERGPVRQRARVPTVDVQGDHVVYEDDDESVHIYERPEVGEDGGLEIELHLKERPKSNRFDFSIQTKGLSFYYQPEITDEKALQNMAKGDTRTLEQVKREIRPENVVGSYAVYHTNKRGNVKHGKSYKTGKFCHIYRPHITDADGNETWGELELDEQNGILTVIVPDNFLVTAAYPVIVDPTFGYTSIGGSTLALNNYQHVAKHTLTENGDIESVTFYASSGDPGYLGRPAIYSTDGTLIATTTNEASVSSTQWYTVNISYSATAGDYGICVGGDGSFFGPRLHYDDVSNLSRNNTFTYPNFRATVSYSASNNEEFSFYATYSVASSASPPTVTTQAVSAIGDTTATGNGNVTDDGGATITERGVCWSTSPSPTTADSKATSAGTTGAFTASMTGLTAGTTYYVRAYAINSEGTSYGSEVSFTTINSYSLVLNTGSYTLTGFQMGIARGIQLLLSSGSYAFTGQTATVTVTRKLTLTAGTYTLTGNPATLRRRYTLTATTGTYAFTGNAAALLRIRSVSLSAGSYLSTGHATGLRVVRRLTLESGTYTITGFQAGLSTGRQLLLSTASYALTGHPVLLKRSIIMTLDSGSYTLTGNTAGVAKGRRLALEYGAYAITGNAASFTVTRRLSLAAGTYAVTGHAASLSVGKSLALSAGSYTLTGHAAGILATRRITLQSGSYTITGLPQQLKYRRISSQEAGEYVLTGNPAALRYQRRFALESGSYALTGFAVGISTISNRTILLSSGSFSVTGNAAGVTVTRRITMTAGTYTFTGRPATITRRLLITLEAGEYAITENPVPLLRRYPLTLTAGTYAVTGSDANLTRLAVLQLETGEYVLTGFDVGVNYASRTRPYCPAPSPYAEAAAVYGSRPSPYTDREPPDCTGV